MAVQLDFSDFQIVVKEGKKYRIPCFLDSKTLELKKDFEAPLEKIDAMREEYRLIKKYGLNEFEGDWEEAS